MKPGKSNNPVMKEIIDGNISISAPGKIILFGEHAVVYDKTALAFSLDLRTTLTVSPSDDYLQITLPALSVSCQWSMSEVKQLWDAIGVKRGNINKPLKLSDLQLEKIKEFLLPIDYSDKQINALCAIFHQYLSILPFPIAMNLTVSSSLPIGGGLGSSAAFSVCATAIFIYLNKKADSQTITLTDLQELICDWSIMSENIFHGKASGIDNAICTYGGAITVTKGNITRIELPALKILLINSGVSRKTENLVNKVRQDHKVFPDIYDSIFTAMHDVGQAALSVLSVPKDCTAIGDTKLRNNHLKLCNLVRINQGLLVSIGVSHPTIDEIVKITKSHGFNAKLTGAGGGGFAYTFIDPNNESLVADCQKELKQKGYDSWIAEIKGKGVSFVE